jgi:hypothetical protein
LWELIETNEKIDAKNELEQGEIPEVETKDDIPVIVKEALPEPRDIPKTLKSDGFKQT